MMADVHLNWLKGKELPDSGSAFLIREEIRRARLLAGPSSLFSRYSLILAGYSNGLHQLEGE